MDDDEADAARTPGGPRHPELRRGSEGEDDLERPDAGAEGGPTSAPPKATTHTRLVAMREDGGERRRAERRPVSLPAAFSTDDLEMDVDLEIDDLELAARESDAAPRRGAVQDVSEGGLFVRSDFLEPPGTPVRLAVSLAKRRIEVRGRVAWVSEGGARGSGMGIALDEASRVAWLAAGVPKTA